MGAPHGRQGWEAVRGGERTAQRNAATGIVSTENTVDYICLLQAIQRVGGSAGKPHGGQGEEGICRRERPAQEQGSGRAQCAAADSHGASAGFYLPKHGACSGKYSPHAQAHCLHLMCLRAGWVHDRMQDLGSRVDGNITLTVFSYLS